MIFTKFNEILFLWLNKAEKIICYPFCPIVKLGNDKHSAHSPKLPCSKKA